MGFVQILKNTNPFWHFLNTLDVNVSLWTIFKQLLFAFTYNLQVLVKSKREK